MRDLRELDRYRLPLPPHVLRVIGKGPIDPRYNGAFVIKYGPPSRSFTSTDLRIIAASGGGWDHVSVSLEDRCPTWAEMEHVKRIFFRDNETAMQLHVPPAKHISFHPHVLHLWRPHGADIPLPPESFV